MNTMNSSQTSSVDKIDLSNVGASILRMQQNIQCYEEQLLRDEVDLNFLAVDGFTHSFSVIF